MPYSVAAKLTCLTRLTILITWYVAAAGIVSAQSSTYAFDVGPNVRVTAAHPDLFHDEVLLATNPADGRHLLACSMVFSREADEWGTVVYLSTDSGASWRPTFESIHGFHIRNGDPACTFGPDSSAFITHLTDNEESPDKEGTR